MIKHFKAVLEKKENIVSDIWELRFRPDQEVPFLAGQYMILKVGDKRRLYSIASAPHVKEYFDLLVQFLPDGVGSNFFRELQVGQTAEFMGPAGQFILRTDHEPKILLATGTGIAPIRSQIDTLLNDCENTSKDISELPELILFWGIKTIKDSYYVEEFVKKMKNHKHFKFYLCLSRETDEHVFDIPYIKKGRINEVLQRYLHGYSEGFPNTYEYVVCGGRDVVTSMVDFLLDHNVLKDRIYFEKF